MITVIAGTNRKDSMTLKMARLYTSFIEDLGGKAQLLSLENLPIWERGEDFIRMEEGYLIPMKKFAFIVPEYNGSFPGILKILFDNSDIKRSWWHKKAMLVGIADGRGGNIRGLDHLTSILHYLRMNIYYNKLPISRVFQEMDEAGQLKNETTENVIRDQVRGFLSY